MTKFEEVMDIFNRYYPNAHFVVLWVNGDADDAIIAAQEVGLELENLNIPKVIRTFGRDSLEIVTKDVVVDVKWRSSQFYSGEIYHQTFVHDGAAPVWLGLHKGYTEPIFEGTLVEYILRLMAAGVIV